MTWRQVHDSVFDDGPRPPPSSDAFTSRTWHKPPDYYVHLCRAGHRPDERDVRRQHYRVSLLVGGRIVESTINTNWRSMVNGMQAHLDRLDGVGMTPSSRWIGELVHMLRDLRGMGWRVAVHNDYEQSTGTCEERGLRTFWLFTRDMGGGLMAAVKGEAGTDAEAVTIAMEQAIMGEVRQTLVG